jgi:hypothetical protein
LQTTPPLAGGVGKATEARLSRLSLSLAATSMITGVPPRVFAESATATVASSAVVAMSVLATGATFAEPATAFVPVILINRRSEPPSEETTEAGGAGTFERLKTPLVSAPKPVAVSVGCGAATLERALIDNTCVPVSYTARAISTASVTAALTVLGPASGSVLVISTVVGIGSIATEMKKLPVPSPLKATGGSPTKPTGGSVRARRCPK